MNVTITPARLHGTVNAIPSKSAAHRLLICAALADRPTKLLLSGTSADINSTISCLEAMGAKVEQQEDGCVITPIVPSAQTPLLDCGESGSTLRFLIPVALAVCGSAGFTGRGRLPQRPIGHLTAALTANGAEFSSETLPLTVSGELKSGTYTLPGNVSSQYITGLLFALPLLEGDSVIALTTKLESSAYIDMTLSALKIFGIKIEQKPEGYFIPGGQKYRSPGTVRVEGDWSNAAFYLAAGAIGESCTVAGLDMQSGQGDRAIADILKQFGAKVETGEDSVTVSPGDMHGITVDISEIPDLLPILAVTAAFARGESRFINGARLRIKECDRLSAVNDILSRLGADVEEGEDWLAVRGGSLTGGCVDSYNDHRIVMSAAIAAIGCASEVTITDAAAANKSYPAFFDDYESLGGNIKRN